MRPSVQTAFWSMTESLEGYDDEMYVDILDLVTVGVGDLVDPLRMALGHPWLHRADDSPASTDEIEDEWRAVKEGHIASRRLVGGSPRPLYLTADAVSALVLNRLRQNEVYLARRWANWSAWPADAQLGGHAIAWAAGPKWRAPKFDAAAAKSDFMTCAGTPGDAVTEPSCRGEAWLRDSNLSGVVTNPGLRRRNLAVKTLFQNASRVLAAGTDPDVLHWPAVIGSP